MKKEIERKIKMKIEVDSEMGEVFIIVMEEIDDLLVVWKVRDVVMVIGRGFFFLRGFLGFLMRGRFLRW